MALDEVAAVQLTITVAEDGEHEIQTRARDAGCLGAYGLSVKCR